MSDKWTLLGAAQERHDQAAEDYKAAVKRLVSRYNELATLEEKVAMTDADSAVPQDGVRRLLHTDPETAAAFLDMVEAVGRIKVLLQLGDKEIVDTLVWFDAFKGG